MFENLRIQRCEVVGSCLSQSFNSCNETGLLDTSTVVQVLLTCIRDGEIADFGRIDKNFIGYCSCLNLIDRQAPLFDECENIVSISFILKQAAQAGSCLEICCPFFADEDCMKNIQISGLSLVIISLS